MLCKCRCTNYNCSFQAEKKICVCLLRPHFAGFLVIWHVFCLLYTLWSFSAAFIQAIKKFMRTSIGQRSVSGKIMSTNILSISWKFISCREKSSFAHPNGILGYYKRKCQGGLNFNKKRCWAILYKQIHILQFRFPLLVASFWNVY